MTTISEFTGLMPTFASTTQRIGATKRFSQFQGRNYHQTALEHCLQLGLLIAFLLKHEPDLEASSTKLIAHANAHDFGEGLLGDIPYPTKKDLRFHKVHDEMEKEATHKLIETFGPLSEFLSDTMTLSEEESQFFLAAECLEYMLYGAAEVAKGNTEFVQVLSRQHPRLVSFANTYASIALLYSSEVQEWVKQMIDKHPQTASAGKVRKPKLADLDLLTQAREEVALALIKDGIAPAEVNARLTGMNS
jgi:5'-deoxynucleotidase YfbR-like HD superfamily hydrolase